MKKVCVICGSIDFEIKSKRFCSQKCIHKYGSINAANTKIKCEFCSKEIVKSGYNNHIKTHELKKYHYFCEYCGKECFEKYGSNRFCRKECAKGFSTKIKRKEINEKVRNTIFKRIGEKGKFGFLKGDTIKLTIEKECPICNVKFKTKNSNKKTCSVKCGAKLGGITNLGSHHIVKNSSKMGGLRQGGGKSKQLPYTNWLGFKMSLNKEEIKVAQELDNLKLNWKRNTKGFPYLTLNNKNRKYYPDFVVNNNIYIEYKGWITEEMEHKMNDAKIKNNLNLIIVIGNDKRYFNKGIKISEMKNISII